MLEKIKKGIWDKKYFLYYTAGFAAIILFLVYIFFSQGKSFVRLVDGLAQHFVVLKYIRSYLLNIFSNGFHLPMVDLSIGQGMDVIGTLNYYGFGDPITLLTVLFPANHLEMMYACMTFARMYLAGLFFMIFIRELGHKWHSHIAVGGLLYAFCGFALIGGIKHPIFLTGMIYLPLILTGIERILKKKSCVFLAVSVGFAFMANYYFMYMNTVLAGLYFLIRLTGSYRKIGIRGFFSYVGKIALGYLWGTCMAAVILLPSVYAFLNNARSGDTSSVDLFYDSAWYYERLLRSTFAAQGATNKWNIPGIGVTGLMGICGLFAVKKDWKKKVHYIMAFVVVVMMMIFPIFGKIMNGFGYVTNRWSYAAALLLTVLAVKLFDQVKKINRLQITGFVLILAAVVGRVLYKGVHNTDLKVVKYSLVFLLGTVLVFIFSNAVRRTKVFRAGNVVLCVVIMAGILLNITEKYASDFYNQAKDHKDRNYCERSVKDAVVELMENTDVEQGYRVEKKDNTVMSINAGAYTGVPTNAFYYSVVPEDVKNLYLSLGMPFYSRPWIFNDLNDMTVLNLISGSRYLVSASKKNAPYSYEQIEEYTNADGKKAYLYKSDLALPIGYTYKQSISKENYDELSLLERQMALLQYAVVEGGQGMETKADINGISTYPCSIRENENISVKENELKIKKAGEAAIDFSTDENKEAYLVFDGLEVSEGLEGPTSVSSKGIITTKMKFSTPKNAAGMEKDGIVSNLGYSSKAQTNATLKFNKKGSMTYDNISIQSLDMDTVERYAKERAEDAFTDITIEDNRISGEVSVSDSRIFQLTVPYSKGWSAYVDGEKTEVFKSGVAYMGINLEAGNHEIVFKYCSPWIVPGAVLSLLAVLGFFIKKYNHILLL